MIFIELGGIEEIVVGMIKLYCQGDFIWIEKKIIKIINPKESRVSMTSTSGLNEFNLIDVERVILSKILIQIIGSEHE